ncbi:UNVERIFIED_CONTAM: hypothetical protein RMT77_011109 [Armadillidium vulgare]
MFVLQTDTSDVSLGAVLMQTYDDGNFPIAFASKKLTMREKAYSTIEKEGLGILFGVKKFDNYLFGKEFILQIDNRPLIFMQKTKYTNTRVMRWALFLQKYKFRIESIKGVNNTAADYMSRIGN